MLDGRLIVQWRRNPNNSMDKTPWATFMESKDKFHNFELAALLKSKAAPTARSTVGSGAKKPGREGRGSGWRHQASGVDRAFPAQSISATT